MNAFEAGYKVGGKVKVWCPYGTGFYFGGTVERITPKGLYVYVKGESHRYRIKSNGSGENRSRWGIGGIKLAKGEDNNGKQ